MRSDSLDCASTLDASKPHVHTEVCTDALLLFIVLLHLCNIAREVAEVLGNFALLALDGNFASGNSNSHCKNVRI